MCEGGLRVTLRIYTADGTDGTAALSGAEARELAALADCSGALGGSMAFSVEPRPGRLRKVLTMEHRREFAAELARPSPGSGRGDVFLFTEDDVLVSLRGVLAMRAAADELRAARDGHKYVAGFNRFEVGGGAAPTEVLWENPYASDWSPVAIGGALWLMPRTVSKKPRETRGFSTLEASISVSLRPIRLLLGPLIISARVLEIWTQKSIASTRTTSC